MSHKRGVNRLSTYTPLQKRRIERKRRRVKLNMWARVLGVITGLSVSSLVVSHSDRGTYAMFFSQAQTSITFSAAKHFKGSDDLIASNCEAAVRQVLQDMQTIQADVGHVKNSTSRGEALRWVSQVEIAVTQLHKDYQRASDLKASLDSIAREDAVDYQNAELAVVQAQQDPTSRVSSLLALANSYQRVESWSTAADLRATVAVQRVANLDQKADAYLAYARQIAARMSVKASGASEKQGSKQGSSSGIDSAGGAATVTSSVYGSVYDSVYGSVYDAVYGYERLIPSNYGDISIVSMK